MLHVHTGFLFKNVNILRILLKHLDSKILTVVASIVKPYLLLHVPVDWDSHESMQSLETLHPLSCYRTNLECPGTLNGSAIRANGCIGIMATSISTAISVCRLSSGLFHQRSKVP